eukprot:150375_1
MVQFCPALLTYSIVLIRSIHALTDVWYEPMNSDPTQSTGWKGNTPIWTGITPAICPGGTDCWYFSDQAGEYQRTASTTDFTSVQLTYSMSSTSFLWMVLISSILG